MMKNDHISRQAAIDDFYKYPNAKWTTLDILEHINALPSAEQYEHITSEIDETLRIASEIRLAVSCNTARECWELARKGDIQRVKHGQWIDVEHAPDNLLYATCSVCGKRQTIEYINYCGNCGAKM